jgi:hypothetical protein
LPNIHWSTPIEKPSPSWTFWRWKKLWQWTYNFNHKSLLIILLVLQVVHNCSGADPGFKVRGAHLKKMRRAEGGANIFWVFRVKNHDFTPKNYIFSNCGGRREHFGGISCDKSQFCAKKSYFFPILGGARAGCAPPPPWIRPCCCTMDIWYICTTQWLIQHI